MRIIAGDFRGRRLLGPQSEATRPITDRAKQSLFDILSPLIANARAYDCFAGTGSMGLECLSRGAQSVVFFEADRSAIKLLRRNIEAMQVQSRARVIDQDLFAWFNQSDGDAPKADLIFLDPPYRYLRERPDELKHLAGKLTASHLRPDGMVILRHDVHDSLELPGLKPADVRQYGKMTIEFLRVS